MKMQILNYTETDLILKNRKSQVAMSLLYVEYFAV